MLAPERYEYLRFHFMDVSTPAKQEELLTLFSVTVRLQRTPPINVQDMSIMSAVACALAGRQGESFRRSAWYGGWATGAGCGRGCGVSGAQVAARGDACFGLMSSSHPACGSVAKLPQSSLPPPPSAALSGAPSAGLPSC